MSIKTNGTGMLEDGEQSVYFWAMIRPPLSIATMFIWILPYSVAVLVWGMDSRLQDSRKRFLPLMYSQLFLHHRFWPRNGLQVDCRRNNWQDSKREDITLENQTNIEALDRRTRTPLLPGKSTLKAMIELPRTRLRDILLHTCRSHLPIPSLWQKGCCSDGKEVPLAEKFLDLSSKSWTPAVGIRQV